MRKSEVAAKKFVSTNGSSVLFDIQVQNQTINGYWGNGRKQVFFDVPGELVEGFEKHYHVQVGNVVPAPADAA